MSRLLRSCAALATLLLLAEPLRAQGMLDRLKKKAAESVEKKAEEKMNAKIDQVAQKLVDNSFASLFGDSSEAGGAGGSAGAGRSPFSLGGNVNTESEYRFSVVTTMEIETRERSGRSGGKAIVLMHFNPQEPYTGTSIISPDDRNSQAAPFVIMDARNEAMVMLMASNQQKFSISYAWKDAQRFAERAAGQPQVNWDTVQVWKDYKRIGTRTIAGYSAEGYRADVPESTIEVWVTRDPRLAVGGMFGANANLRQMRGRLPAEFPQGVMLEMTNLNKSSGESVIMKVTAVETNANKSFAMADYPKLTAGKK